VIASSVIDSMRRMASSALRVFPALFFSAFLLGLTSGSAQSLGDVARQERDRLSNKSDKSTRVFTNEDLARPTILEEHEQEDSDAQTGTAFPPATPAPAPVSASEPAVKKMVVPAWPEGTPLGDVARYYRQLKELRSEPGETPILAQDSPIRSAPVQDSPVRRQNQNPFSPDQPAQKPKRIVAVPEPAVRDNAPAPSVVRVSPGDSLWKLASRYLGDGNQWTEIASANPEIADPNLIRVGQQIRLPGSLPGENTAVAAAANQVRVQPGDSLWKLAEAQWGDGLAWSCIAESNPQVRDSSKIYPGQTLALPASCSLSI